MARKTSTDIQDIAKKLTPNPGKGRGRRSALFRWMFERADDLQRLLNDIQPAWDDLAKILSEQNLTNGRGESPTGERVRKTWFEVRQAKGWMTPPKTQAPVVAAPSPPSDALDPPARTFRTAKLRGHAPSSPPPPSTTAAPDTEHDRAQRVIEELMKNAPTNRFKPDDGV